MTRGGRAVLLTIALLGNSDIAAARADAGVTDGSRRTAARAAFVVALATLGGLALAARRLRAKAGEEAADRALAEEFEGLEKKR